ncbi:MAG: hypothetical protein O7D91_15760 [Planctomycetota bacterium]|nr:hypothetical protein [Planctomycetota bacterium]
MVKMLNVLLASVICGGAALVGGSAEGQERASAQPKVYRVGDRISRLYGSVLAKGSSAEAASEQFLAQYTDMLGVAIEHLRPLSRLADQRHTQPVMYDQLTGTYKFTLVYYAQYMSGIPVFRADLRVLVRNQPGYPVVLAASGLRELGDFSPSAQPTPAEDPALGVKAAKALFPTLVDFTEGKRIIWAGLDDMVVQSTVAYTFVGSNEQVESWLFVADAVSGEVLYQEDQVLRQDVAGNVSGLATDGVGADVCGPELLEPMPYARVNIGSTIAYADEEGNFVIPNAGTDDVTVESGVRGQFFRVFNYDDPQPPVETVLSQTVTPPGPANFTHNAGNEEFTRAEVNAYIEANFARDGILRANKAYPSISTETEFPVNVNRVDGSCACNGWYAINAPQSINFCRAEPNIHGCENAAFAAWVHHEYGHHLVQMGGSGQYEYGEGMGDVMGVVLLDDPLFGVGYYGSCWDFLRTADNNCQYLETGCSTCGSQIHACGQLLSGCVWDTRNELVVTEPDDYQDILMSLAVNSVLVHSDSSIGPDILIDWLTLDDDDANMNNGTPHFDEICTGFGAHGFDCPVLEVLDFQYPTGLPEFVTPGQTTVIPVNVEPAVDDPVAGSGTVSYRIGASGRFTTLRMAEITPNHYEATLPAANCRETIYYYFEATAVSAGVVSDPPDAPTTTFTTTSASGTQTVFSDDFETEQGWAVADSAGLTGGAWDRGMPAGGGDRGDPPTDADGSGQCYVTENEDGNSDVDNGSTTLTSPVMDAACPGSVISYHRWFSNTEGDSPMQDTFSVEVSSNGGADWMTLETVGPSGLEVGGGWFYKEFKLSDILGFTQSSSFRIRFIASDVDPQSLVEAGVDGVRLFTLECPCPADLDGDGEVGSGDLAILLGAWGPNPGHPADLDCDTVVGPGDLAILLGNWGPCGMSASWNGGPDGLGAQRFARGGGNDCLPLEDAVQMLGFADVDAFIAWVLSEVPPEWVYQVAQFLVRLLDHWPC